MSKIVVIGGGWAGCSAALTAGLAGEEVYLLERSDMLLGAGLAGGIMRNNGRWTATEEIVEMGGGEIFKIIDRACIHQNLDFPGQMHSSIYDVTKIEVKIKSALEKAGVKLLMKSRADDVVVKNGTIHAIVTTAAEEIEGFEEGIWQDPEVIEDEFWDEEGAFDEYEETEYTGDEEFQEEESVEAEPEEDAMTDEMREHELRTIEKNKLR